MNKDYELHYAIIDEQQVEQFGYGMTADVINQYVLEHQEEFELWKAKDKIKQIIRKCIPMNLEFGISKRKEMLSKFNKEGSNNNE